MWKKHYMYRNLSFFLIPLLVPVLILGTLSIMITQHFIKENINERNLNMLTQTKDNLELILNEMDTLSLSFQANDSISVRLKAILRSNTLSYEQLLALDLINSTVSAPANARPFIDSIYVYYDNPDRNLLTSTEVGRVALDKFYDRGWYDSYLKGNPADSWLEERFISRSGVDKTHIISMYRKLYPAGSSSPTGVLVLNIKPDYIESMLHQLVMAPEQTVFLIGNDHRILFQANKQQVPPDRFDLGSIAAGADTVSTISAGGENYIVSHLRSDRHGVHYISLIPQSVLYKIPLQLSQITFVLLALSLAIGVVITYVLTKKNYHNLKNIVSIINSAERGTTLPALPSKIKDEYGFILQNVIKTFIEQSYLKIQLSERGYKLRLMEMLALQSQINPHFLYNTLEIIYWKTVAISGKPNEASTMIEHLGDILKYALSSPQHSVILQMEIQHTQIYLEIQKIRYKDKFEVVWDIEADTQRYSVPKLLLQPLIENSIYHGIKEKEGKSTIKIKTRRVNSDIVIHVIDNGIGMSKERLKALQTKLETDDSENPLADSESMAENSGHNIGLYNTNKRLKLSFGEQYGLRILSKAGRGTSVQIRIPVERE